MCSTNQLLSIYLTTFGFPFLSTGYAGGKISATGGFYSYMRQYPTFNWLKTFHFQLDMTSTSIVQIAALKAQTQWGETKLVGERKIKVPITPKFFPIWIVVSCWAKWQKKFKLFLVTIGIFYQFLNWRKIEVGIPITEAQNSPKGSSIICDVKPGLRSLWSSRNSWFSRHASEKIKSLSIQ